MAKYYDDVFPLDPAKLTFLTEVFRSVKAARILDVACGTGTYTLALADRGYEVWGTDLEPQMVELAQQKARTTNNSAHFAVGDMRNPAALELSFNGLFCIGNSLAHLAGERELENTLISLRKVLTPGSVAIFQIVNFDRILAEGDTPLPLIEYDNVRFIRIYRPQSEDKLIFNSTLELKQVDGTTVSMANSITLHPIRKARLESYLLAAGFTTVRTYGGFTYQEFTVQSPATIMVAYC
ncbi:MAG: class I SAM-dependent methyltransferase [Firmicutes bacterium]|nr:class I SAM-dependent methyltransferase [Bacillota bacterium]